MKPIHKYLLVLVGFFLSIVILYIAIDSFIMPMIVTGQDTVKIPDLTGMNKANAEKLLSGKGLEFSQAGEQYSENFASGAVIKQLPKPYSTVKVGRKIFCTVSKGRETVSVPYIIGKDIRSANVLLMKKGLVLGNISFQYSDFYSQDTIVSQSVQSGIYVPYGDTINIVVSKGPEKQIIVPYLIGLSLESARQLIEENELIIESVNYQEQETFLPNTIIKQYPSSGELVSKGAAVLLTVSK